MPYQLNAQQLNLAFNQGRQSVGAVTIDFSVVEAGAIELLSGYLVAADPFVMPIPAAFTQTVPCGRFPVELALAHLHNQEERIAYARVIFSTKVVSRWEMATTAEQRLATLGADEFFGYAAAEGAGAFMDAEIAPRHAEIMGQEAGYFDWLLGQMAHTFQPTRGWLSFLPVEERKENIVCFTSGWGNGYYPTFFGLDADGAVVQAVTDFMVIPVETSVAGSSRPWWRFW